MISLDLLLKHMQWANKEIYTETMNLIDEWIDELETQWG